MTAERPRRPAVPPLARGGPSFIGVGPPPLYKNWDDFLAKTTHAYRREWCKDKAKKANQPYRVAGLKEGRLTPGEVLQVLTAAQGRCCYCGSLAVEKRPSRDGSWVPLPWAHVGRRIGSLEHVPGRTSAKQIENVAWACLWCNVWTEDRTPGAIDHGGYYPA